MLSQWREAKVAASKRRRVEAWVEHLRKSPPDILIGGNFAEFGGIRHHLRAIQRYSSLRVELAPSDDLLESVSPHELVNVYPGPFAGFAPSAGTTAIHSHVY